jgi:hypothetical protein
MLAIVVAGDQRPLPVLGTTDYLSTFYVAGYMVDHHQEADLYPRMNATNFYTEKFTSHVHELIPREAKKWTDIFNYPVVIALLAAPFSLFSPINSLIAWQIFSFAALVLSACLFAKTDGVETNPAKIMLSAGAFFPVLNVIVTGQTSLILGLLPYTAGYFCWQRQCYFIAGLSWSIMGLKPQLAIPIFLITTSLAIVAWLKPRAKFERREPLLIMSGLITGTLALHVLPMLYFGPQSLLFWLNTVKLTGQVFAAEETGYWQYHLFFSVPCLLILILPKSWWQIARLPSYFLGGFFMLLGLLACSKITQLDVEQSCRQDLLIILATTIVFATAPHLLLYDACLLLLPAWIIFYKLKYRSVLMRRTAMATLVGFFAFDIYGCLLISPSGLPTLPGQLLIVAGLLIGASCFFFAVCKSEANQII